MSAHLPAVTCPDAEIAYAALERQVASWLDQHPGSVLVGIHSGGVWIADRLRTALCPASPHGALSSAFHRDDYTARGLRVAGGTAGSTRIDFAVEGASILLVDDILHTGRTVRAALNELFDYGRPARVALAVLLDRGGRELPVQPDCVGATVLLTPGQSFVLARQGEGFALSVETV